MYECVCVYVCVLRKVPGKNGFYKAVVESEERLMMVKGQLHVLAIPIFLINLTYVGRLKDVSFFCLGALQCCAKGFRCYQGLGSTRESQ